MLSLSFPNATLEMMNNLSYRMTAFLNDIYPLLHQTFKEKNALDNAIKDFKYPNYEEIVKDTIFCLLKICAYKMILSRIFAIFTLYYLENLIKYYQVLESLR